MITRRSVLSSPKRDEEEEKEKDEGKDHKLQAQVPDRFAVHGRMMGRYAYNRFPEDNEYVRKIADAYLTTNEKNILSKLLGYDSFASVEFTPEEAQILVSRSHDQFITGTKIEAGEKEEIGFPFVQLFDFIMTFDALLARIRGLQVQVNNLDELGDPANKQVLREEIQSDTGLPWSIHEKTGGVTSHIVRDKDEYAGMVIGSTNIYEARYKRVDDGAGAEAKAPGAKKEAEKSDEEPTEEKLGAQVEDKKKEPKVEGLAIDDIYEKTGYQRACDEALYLSFPVLNAAIALGQGLFQIFVTKAPLWQVNADKEKIEKVEGKIIGPGNWINAFTGPVAIRGYKPKQPHLFQPKYLDIKDYPGNQFQYFHRKTLYDSTDLYGKKGEGKVHTHDGAGGAIGRFIYVVGKEEDGSEDFPRATKKSERFQEHGYKVEAEMNNFDMSWVRKAMTNQPNHPIYACPRLAQAWDESKAWKYVLDMYNRLRRLFTSKQKFSTLGVRVDSMMDALAIQSKIESVNARVPCQKGFLNAFYDYEGKPVPIEKAVYLGDEGKLKLNTAIVDPKRGACIPEVDAPPLPRSFVDKLIGPGVMVKQSPYLNIDGKTFSEAMRAPDQIPEIEKEKMAQPLVKKVVEEAQIDAVGAEEALDQDEDEEEDEASSAAQADMSAKVVRFRDNLVPQTLDVQRLLKDRNLRRTLLPVPAAPMVVQRKPAPALVAPRQPKSDGVIQTDMRDGMGRPIYQHADGGLFKLVEGRQVWITKMERNSFK